MTQFGLLWLKTSIIRRGRGSALIGLRCEATPPKGMSNPYFMPMYVICLPLEGGSAPVGEKIYGETLDKGV